MSGSLDVYCAVELCEALALAVSRQADPAVDLAGVASCDFTTIQSICAARRSANEAGKSLTITAVSEAVRETCAALGLPREMFSTEKSE